MKQKIFAASAAIVLMSGCATRPANISAQYVSSGKYADYSCKQLYREAQEVDLRVGQLTGTLESKANTDAVLVGVGALLFWPALLALPANSSKAEEAEFARLKGESQALYSAAKDKNCDTAKVLPSSPPQQLEQKDSGNQNMTPTQAAETGKSSS